METLLPLLVLFGEPGFPWVDVPPPRAVSGAAESRSIAELTAALKPGRILVWRHGSAFPAEAWSPLCQFLEQGGSILCLGGEPFTRPVVGPAGKRVVQPRTISMLRTMRLNQCYRVPAGNAELSGAGALASLPQRRTDPDTWVSILEPRLCDAKDYPDEEGSPGPRDAVIRPLMFLRRPGVDRRFPFATAAYSIEHASGKWAGGRWTFWLASTPPTEDELAALLRAAAAPVVDFRVDPTLGCYHEGEKPALNVRVSLAKAAQPRPFDVAIVVRTPDGKDLAPQKLRLNSADPVATRVELQVSARPGLYRVSTSGPELPDFTTGFWVFDPQLFGSGGQLTFDQHTLRRDGKPEPIVGTTVMSATVHRHFLFEPNAAAWDDAFAELAASHMNVVRTGVWSGWKRIMPDNRNVDEAWLRALEAYYLTARKHDIPVIFNFFAFFPPAYGGDNPYFDPNALAAQRAYLAAVAHRFAPAREMLWDLINEPSFSSPKSAWLCRPHGDAHETEAFLKWLGKQYTPAENSRLSWEDAVRARWRLAPEVKIGLPVAADFEDRTVFAAARPYRAADYVHFAQDAFAGWAADMSATVRRAGSRGAITVGQDEGGLTTRPSPLFHHDRLDFTSMHTWWNNDALLWDGVLAKATARPLLVSETGIMQRELLSGEAHRTPDEFARLLSRKIGYAFAADAFGVVQWCYDVNVYMDSDNEVAIGLRRADGSYKPEHGVLREFAAFVARNQSRFDAPRAPDVALILPSADFFSPRDHATAATRRAIDVLYRQIGVAVRAVPDYRAMLDLGQPRAVILPANRGISDDCWRAIQRAVQSGALLICSGWFETDDAGLPASRLALSKRPLRVAEQLAMGPAAAATVGPASRRSSIGDESAEQLIVYFPAAVAQSWYAAEGDSAPRNIKLNKDRVWHHPLPLEWSDNTAVLQSFYADGLKQAGITASADAVRAAQAGVLLRQIEFEDSILVIAINESPRDCTVTIGGVSLSVPAATARLAFLDRARQRMLDSTKPWNGESQ